MPRRSTRELLLRVREQGLEGTGSKISDVTKRTGGLKTAWGAMGKAAKIGLGAVVIGTAAATAATLLFGKTVISTGAQMERFETQLTTVLKNQKQAVSLLGEITTFAAQTPFELPELIEASVRLEQFGFKSQEILKIIGDTAAALDKPILQAAEAMADAMTGEFERLKEFGINTAKITEELGTAIGRDTPAALKKNVDAVLRIMERDFTGGMQRLSETWTGIMSNFADFFFKLRADIADAGIFETVKNDAKVLLDTLNRFAEAGAVTALAEGLNAAFQQMHSLFFAPFIEGLDDLEVNVERFSLNVEVSMLKIMDATSGVVIGFTALRAGWRQFLRTFDPKNVGEQSPADAFREALQAGEDLTRQIEILTEVAQRLPEILAGGAIDVADMFALDEVLDASLIAKVEGTIERLRKLRDDINKPGAAPFIDVEDLLGSVEAIIPPEDLERIKERKAILMRFLREQDITYFSSLREQALQTSSFWIDTMEMAEGQISTIFGQLGGVTKRLFSEQAKFSKGVNALLIRGGAEVAKALIAQTTKRAKIQALFEGAQAIAAAAEFRFASAAAHAAAAAKFGLITGVGAAAAAFIEARAQASIEAELARDDPTQGGGLRGDGVRDTGAARTVRTGPQTQIIQVTIINNVSGDYNVSEGDATDADQLQELFEDGTIATV